MSGKGVAVREMRAQAALSRKHAQVRGLCGNEQVARGAEAPIGGESCVCRRIPRKESRVYGKGRIPDLGVRPAKVKAGVGNWIFVPWREYLLIIVVVLFVISVYTYNT